MTYPTRAVKTATPLKPSRREILCSSIPRTEGRRTQNSQNPCPEACPPEDCGGIEGYLDLLETLGDPDSEEHDVMIEWLKGHHRNYHPFDPDKFDPETVKFTDPKKRLKRLLDR